MKKKQSVRLNDREKELIREMSRGIVYVCAELVEKLQPVTSLDAALVRIRELVTEEDLRRAEYARRTRP